MHVEGAQTRSTFHPHSKSRVNKTPVSYPEPFTIFGHIKRRLRRHTACNTIFPNMQRMFCSIPCKVETESGQFNTWASLGSLIIQSGVFNSLNAKCIYTCMRELSASPSMQWCVLCCVDQNHFEYHCRCMEVQYLHACNPIVIQMFEHMWSWCKHILCVHYNPLAPFVAITHNTNW